MSKRQSEQKGFDNLDALIRISRKDEQLKDPYVLHDLCLRQEIDLLIQLLDSSEGSGHRQNIDGRNQNGLTPLHVAVVSPEPPYLEDLINYLLYYGADRDAKCTPDGNTSLHLAIIFSKLVNAEISVPLLLKEGAVPNLRNFADRMPKDYAYAKGYADLAALLEEIELHPERRHEIDIYNWKEKFGAGKKSDPELLENAIRQGDSEAVKQLASRMADGSEIHEMLCYHRAVLEARQNKAQVIDSLASSGVDPNGVDGHGNTPIQLAISSLPHDRQMLDVIKALLKAGVPKETKNKDNKDALMMAIERNYNDVEELLRGGKRPEPAKLAPPKQPPPQTAHRGRPVHEILADKGLTSKRKLDELQQLWTNNPSTNPNVRSTDGMEDTPLHVVVRRDQEDLADFFLSKNAIVNVKNKRGETPLTLAQQTEFGFNVDLYQRLKDINKQQVTRRRWNQLAGRIEQNNGRPGNSNASASAAAAAAAS